MVITDYKIWFAQNNEFDYYKNGDIGLYPEVLFKRVIAQF